MKKLFISLFLIAFQFSLLSAQTPEPISLSIEEVSITGLPALQSFVGIEHDGKWILLGGRTDGLHDHRPPYSFPSSMANDKIWVVNPATGVVNSASISTLPDPIQNQCLATNIEFFKTDSTHFIMLGGYGVDVNSGLHTTFDVVTRVDIPSLVYAIEQGTSITSAFEYLQDSRFEITGGYLGMIDDTLYQVGGQYFDGRYNPNNGPSFVQVYNENIQKFTLSTPSQPLQVTSYEAWNNSALLHRRDYNMLPQIMPDGAEGLTAFTGVFRPNVDLPWFNTVDILNSGYHENTGFEQYLSHYHSASLPIYDAQANQMHSYFFGGMAMYYYDNGVLTEDSLVPFVKTISKVTRYSDDSMTEEVQPWEMDGYIGSGAEFLIANNVPTYANGVIQLNVLSSEKTLIGYIYGGIESTDPNIFMQASGSSSASNRVFKVYLTKESPNSVFPQGKSSLPIDLKVYPNPVDSQLNIEISSSTLIVGNFELIALNGTVVKQWTATIAPSKNTIEVSTENYPAGSYLLKVSGTSDQQKIISFIIK